VTGFLLDTNVISELMRPRPERRVVEWIEATDENVLFISVLTLGEIRKGIAALTDAMRRVKLESWLEHDLALRFSGRILTIDAAIADRWGRISGSTAAKRSPIPVIDALLAATALHHDLILVTRDMSHAGVSGATMLNPWKDPVT
jgi:predicted nucleic acid-binding protein